MSARANCAVAICFWRARFSRERRPTDIVSRADGFDLASIFATFFFCRLVSDARLVKEKLSKPPLLLKSVWGGSSCSFGTIESNQKNL